MGNKMSDSPNTYQESKAREQERRERKLKSPLRKVIRTVRHTSSMYDTDIVELECGHSTHSNSMNRARCIECFELNKKEKSDGK